MCGVCGVVSFEREPTREEVAPMERALTHRGPDDSGIWATGPAALGFRRLSIIDLTTGHQPMERDGVTLVFNGEIYNFRTLRKDLEAKAHRFTTTSDTEVLLAGYREWGSELLHHLEGMFAFALWDSKERRLFAARDRFGEKPLYYRVHGHTLLFASELKALMQHPQCPFEIDATALRRYLAFEYVPAPDCILHGVSKLPPGHSLVFDERGLKVERYFRLAEGKTSWPWSGYLPGEADGAAEQLRALLRDAVRDRMISDVPLGVFLSGGIDSSAVAAMATQAASKVKTFSIAFEEASFDESAHARHVAKVLGTEHHEERLSADACAKLAPELSHWLDEPFADASFLPTLLLSRFTKRHVTVALGGDGADELFAGYDTFVADAPAAVYERLPGGVREALRWASGKVPARSGYMTLDFKVKSFLKGAAAGARDRHQVWIGSFSPEKMSSLLTPAWAPQGNARDEVFKPIDDFAAGRTERGVDWVSRYYMSTYLPDDILVKVDRASMAASLEVRAPFLDSSLTRWVLTLPPAMKLRAMTQRKWLLKRALKGVLPNEILHRKKHGFALPVAAWLKGSLRPWMEELLSESSLRDGGIFEPAAVRALIDAHLDGRQDNRKQLWTLLMFEQWRRAWLKGRGQAKEALSA